MSCNVFFKQRQWQRQNSVTHSNNTERFPGHVVRGVDNEREHQNVYLVAGKDMMLVTQQR